jgi:hypothetical protein
MKLKQIKPNLLRVDAPPNGIFYMSFNTPIVYIKGLKVLENRERYSSTSTRHLSLLRKQGLLDIAELVDASIIAELAKKAGIVCHW